jgi:carbonic anhydrase
VHTDLNSLSVLQYAVEVLKVKHIIVCGHYNCGGVKAALGNTSLGIIDAWLRNIKDVYRFNEEAIESCATEDEKLNKLIEFNVIEQVNNLAKNPIVQGAWKNRDAPHLHGWVYDLRDGIINPVCEVAPNAPFDDAIYKYANL